MISLILMKFLKVIDNFSVNKKRNLVQFITGVRTLPFPKSEVIRIEMPFMSFGEEDTRNNFNRLPTAHTCTNTIELPNYLECMMKMDGYNSVEDLDEKTKNKLLSKLEMHVTEKLSIAIEEMGYGLDEIQSDQIEPTLEKKGKNDDEQKLSSKGNVDTFQVNTAKNDDNVEDNYSDDLFGSFESLDIPGLSSDDESPRF